MGNWYKITMTANDAISNGWAMQLQEAFQEILITSGPIGKDAAMFASHSLDFDWHYFYFSPQAAIIADVVIAQYGGVTCEAPPLSDYIRMCAGYSGARR